MAPILLILALLLLGTGVYLWLKRRADNRLLAQYSISPEELRSLLAGPSPVPILDVRQPLDLLVDSEIIPGSRRIPPKEILANPGLVPKDQDVVVYCTCPSDRTSRAILRRVLAIGFMRVKFLRGGLAAWKAQGFPVDPYLTPFHLDTA